MRAKKVLQNLKLRNKQIMRRGLLDRGKMSALIKIASKMFKSKPYPREIQ